MFNVNASCDPLRFLPAAYNICVVAEEAIKKEIEAAKECLGETFFPKSWLFGPGAQQVIKTVMSEYLYNLIFVASGSQVTVFGLQPQWVRDSRSIAVSC